MQLQVDLKQSCSVCVMSGEMNKVHELGRFKHTHETKRRSVKTEDKWNRRESLEKEDRTETTNVKDLKCDNLP